MRVESPCHAFKNVSRVIYHMIKLINAYPLSFDILLFDFVWLA